MILGNKCDMEDKRQVSRERGEAVSACLLFFVCLLFFALFYTDKEMNFVNTHTCIYMYSC